MTKALQIDAGRLRHLLDYNPETGEFRWLVSRGRVKAGAVAGSVNPTTGYRCIRIDGRLYQANRLAWFYMAGEWPVEQVDHRNTVPGDDRWGNLREASHAQNMRNYSKPRHNTSGVKGVYWNAGRSKWQAQIKVGSRNIYLGLFTDLDAAAAAYAAASKKYHGEYGRTE
jgi:hypothetical protein